MPLLSESPGYSEWGNEAKRRTRMLHNRPVSLGGACFIINLKGSGSLTDKEAIGYAKHKLKSKMDEGEEAIKNGVCYEPIDYEWMCEVFKSMCQEQAGAPKARIARQLNELETIIYRELGVRARTPEVVWGWIGGIRRGLKSWGIVLTNREMLSYFRGANIVKTHKLHAVIEIHFLAMEFDKQLAAGDAEYSQDDFGKFLRTIGDYLDTDAPGKQFGGGGCLR